MSFLFIIRSNSKILSSLFFIGLFIRFSLPDGASAKCVINDGHSSNLSATQPLELGGCVNLRCPDNYECNSAYKCCLSAALHNENAENSTRFKVIGRPFLNPTAIDGNSNFTNAIGGLKETIDGFKNFVRVIFSL